MSPPIPIEVCIDSLESAQLAAPHLRRDDRFEVCSSLISGGGLTPSIGLVRLLRDHFPDIGLMIMIRPRPGSFVYSDPEIAVMAADIRAFKELGVRGIAVGCLREDGHVDTDVLRRLASVAEPLEMTFHRAFDVTPSAERSIHDIASIPGFTRILTSGHAATALQGSAELCTLTRLVPPHLTILPASGINASTLAELKKRVPDLKEAHLSASAAVRLPQTPTLMRGVALGFGSGEEWHLVSEKLLAVRELVDRGFE